MIIGGSCKRQQPKKKKEKSLEQDKNPKWPLLEVSFVHETNMINSLRFSTRPKNDRCLPETKRLYLPLFKKLN